MGPGLFVKSRKNLTTQYKEYRKLFVYFPFCTTRAYDAIAPELLGCASHSYLLREESVTDKHHQLLLLIKAKV